jgi:hypothetical protein
MCLSTVDRRSDDPKVIHAWKVFSKFRSSQSLMGRYRGGLYRSGRWYDKKNDPLFIPNEVIKADDDHYYPTGFHAFLTRKEARIWNNCYQRGPSKNIISRVKLRGSKTYGGKWARMIGLCQVPVRTVVANEMLIISGSKG